MAQLCTIFEASHLLTLLYDNILSFVFFLYSYPLHLVYLLYFSPYILQLISFLFPLLLSTSILLLLFSFHSILEGEDDAACLLDQLGSLVVATIGNVFEWEFEAMVQLHKNVSLFCEVEEDDSAGNSEHLESHSNSFDEPEEMHASIHDWRTMGEFDQHSSLNCEGKGDLVELPSKNSEKIKLLENCVGIGERSHSRSISFEPQTPSMGEFYEISSQNCDTREDPPEISSDKSKRSEILESHSEIGDQVNLQGRSFVPQTPDRISEILASSPLARRAKLRAAASESLSRGGSMRIAGEFYKHSSPNREVVEGPNEIFADCSEKNELSRSRSEKGGSFMSRNSGRRHQTLNDCPSPDGLQRDGSMRKEKEWRRTLACKLYEERKKTFKLREERRAVEEAEEMDLLWEAYEADADKANKFKNKGKKEAFIEEEEEEEKEAVGQLCCLQALRLSTAKMNLGVGRPNIAKISKVFKGIGLFHRSGSRRSRNMVES